MVAALTDCGRPAMNQDCPYEQQQLPGGDLFFRGRQTRHRHRRSRFGLPAGKVEPRWLPCRRLAAPGRYSRISTCRGVRMLLHQHAALFERASTSSASRQWERKNSPSWSGRSVQCPASRSISPGRFWTPNSDTSRSPCRPMAGDWRFVESAPPRSTAKIMARRKPAFLCHGTR